jgi:hypothetical protein
MEDFPVIWKIVFVAAHVIGGVTAIIAPLALIGRWILAPIDRAAKSRKAPVRFSISDFLCLFLAIQIPLAAIHRFTDYGDNRPYWIFFTITWLVGPFVWYCCARTLSKAGVVKGSHRFVFMGLVMPLVYYGFLPFLFLTITNFLLLIGNKDATGDIQPAWTVWPWLTLVVLFWLCGLYTHYMVNHIDSRETAPAIADGHTADASPFNS